MFRFPGDRTAASFLATCWQRQPLACPAALDVGPWTMDAEDLLGLATEDGVAARLVTRKGSIFDLVTGPIEAERLDRLGARDWTLLVQSLEAWEPRYHRLIDLFGFLPRWRIDDVMISLAAEGGGVGPHLDQYDVFLVQVAGRRRWRYGGPVHPLVDGAPLRLLSRFEPDAEVIATPGDVLYLPPGVPHDGVALDDGCMTISVGFRAAGIADLADRLAETLAERWEDDVEHEPRFGDAGRACAAADPWLLDAADIERARHLLEQALAEFDVSSRLLGEQATMPRLAPQPRDRATGQAGLLRLLRAGGYLERWSGSRFAWTPGGTTGALLFADGRSFTCCASFAAWIARQDRVDNDGLAPWRRDAEVAAVLAALVDQGSFGVVPRQARDPG